MSREEEKWIKRLEILGASAAAIDDRIRSRDLFAG